MMNENGISNILVDVDFLESEFKAMGKADCSSSFAEIRMVRLVILLHTTRKDSFDELYACCFQTTSLILDNSLASYLQPAARRSQYAAVDPKHLAALLEKLVRYGLSSRVQAEKEMAERRRRDYEAITRLG
jgi:hypothetical protein